MGIVLFTIVNSAGATCVSFDFGTITTNGHDILDTYDGSGLFKGYWVCVDDGSSLNDTKKGDVGIGPKSVTVENRGIKITIYKDVSDVPKCDFGSSYNGDVKDVVIKQIVINGYPATYQTYQMDIGREDVDRETGKPLRDMYSTSDPTIPQAEYMSQVNEYMLKRAAHDYRTVTKYENGSGLYMQIDPTTLLTMHGTGYQDPIKLFKSINISKITGESPKYLITEGNRLFNEGLFEEALIVYGKIAAYNKYPTRYETSEVVDNTGMALYKLGRYNETLDWFDINKPRSSQTWNIYGQLLESKNFMEEAEYAFSEAKDKMQEEEYRAQLDEYNTAV